MPRSRDLTGTNVHPKDTGSLVPYIHDFIKLLKPADTVTTTKDLLDSYMKYLSTRTEAKNLHSQAKTGFRRKVMRLAAYYRIRNSTKPRGYYVSLPEMISIPEINEDGMLDLDSCIEIKFIDKQVGFGIFATCDIPRNYKLVEYKGQWITYNENEKRKKLYGAHNLPSVVVYDFRNKLILDANRNEQGDLFDADENIARYFNNSKQNPNCRLVRYNLETSKTCFLVTRVNVPKGLELTFNFGEPMDCR